MIAVNAAIFFIEKDEIMLLAARLSYNEVQNERRKTFEKD